MEVNREYRDRLFKFIFGNPEKKEWTLSLYNAMNGSDYTDADAIRFNTLEDIVYMSMKNDVSFLVDNSFNFYEQQSTFNPNMPMRFLIYAGMIYGRFVEESPRYRRFSSTQQSAPLPKCICFYNGTDEKEDKVILRLSDAFKKDADGSPLPERISDIEVTVTMINVNYGHNKELLEACRPLKEYSYFVDSVRINREKSETLAEAVSMAIMALPEDSVIKPFLLANKAEVTFMCLTEYDEAKAFAEQKEEGIEVGIEIGEARGFKKGHAEGRAEGHAEGRAEGIEIGEARGEAKGAIKTLVGLVQKGLLSIIDAAKESNMPVAEFSAKTGLPIPANS